MAQVSEKIKCYHCGDECEDVSIIADSHFFCCTGCKLVYEILKENNLCSYYNFQEHPGFKKNVSASRERFKYLDESTVKDRLISFKKGTVMHVFFRVPSMHCSSCIWLLENLRSVHSGIISSRVDFTRKTLRVVFDESKILLSELVHKLDEIGYEPELNLEIAERSHQARTNRAVLYRLGVAGFCLGNIMLFSFPEYFAGGKWNEADLKGLFRFLNLALALPVFFYSSAEFFKPAWNGIRQKSVVADLPISIGIIAVFFRSVFEVLSGTGSGYFDSMTGLVFFMLAGRWFQGYTFNWYAFDRNYKAYFPIAVSRIEHGNEHQVPVYDLKVNDRIRLRHHEILPVDGLLVKGKALVDYSFVTGESELVPVEAGEIIFAGGRQMGSSIELSVKKEVTQSRITRLWDQQILKPDAGRFSGLVSSISRWFIVIVFIIAAGAALWWLPTDNIRAMNAFTAVLVIACPCALALSAPFTFGNILRKLGRHKIYLKNSRVIEQLAAVDTIIFDKTGTLTDGLTAPFYIGEELNGDELDALHSLCGQSLHPLSRKIFEMRKDGRNYPVEEFIEEPGKGISGKVKGVNIKCGNEAYTGCTRPALYDKKNTIVFISINGICKGYYEFKTSWRRNLASVISSLRQKKYELTMLSGDHHCEQKFLSGIFGSNAALRFNQSPVDKLNYVRALQGQGKKVLMVGDGLNDAGALLQSNAGISIAGEVNNFTPASDGVMDASVFEKLPVLLKYSKSAVAIVITSFIISLFYNFIGLYFAVQGTLSPVIAAILMPISTTSLVLFTVVASTWKGRKLGFR